jgi:hypothetical protein
MKSLPGPPMTLGNACSSLRAAHRFGVSIGRSPTRRHRSLLSIPALIVGPLRGRKITGRRHRPQLQRLSHELMAEFS